MIMEVFKHIPYQTRHFTGFAGVNVSFIKDVSFVFMILPLQNYAKTYVMCMNPKIALLFLKT